MEMTKCMNAGNKITTQQFKQLHQDCGTLRLVLERKWTPYCDI